MEKGSKTEKKKKKELQVKLKAEQPQNENGEHKFSWNCFFMNLNEKSAFHLEKVSIFRAHWHEYNLRRLA